MKNGNQAVRNLFDVLAEIGEDSTSRSSIVRVLKQIEKDVHLPLNRSIREELTGPITDALFKNAGVLQKKLKDGTVFNFEYLSKIARDFVLSPEDEPDHVFEPQTTKLFLHLARNAQQIIIGGAYCGDHAIPVTRFIAPNGLVHCFEPNTEQRELLIRNAKENDVFGHIRAVDLGLWDHEITLELIGEDAFAHAVPMPDEKDGNAVCFRATSIELYAQKNDIKHIDLILMDIEGSELSALKGALPFLSQPSGIAPNIIFEVHRHYVDWSEGLENTDIVKFLHELGYSVYAVRDFQSNVPMVGCKIELIEPKDVYLEGPPHGFNMLAAKDEEILKSDIFRMAKNVSPKLLLHKDRQLHWPTEWLS